MYTSYILFWVVFQPFSNELLAYPRKTLLNQRNFQCPGLYQMLDKSYTKTLGFFLSGKLQKKCSNKLTFGPSAKFSQIMIELLVSWKDTILDEFTEEKKIMITMSV